jgi:hypothetical protein
MGAGQALADEFLAHSYRLLFGQQIPTIIRAKLVVAWTIQHVVRYNPILEKRNEIWEARYEDPGETEQQVAALENTFRTSSKKQQPDAAAEASTVDVDKVLAGEVEIGNGS